MGNLVSGREVNAGGVMDAPPQGIMGMETGMGGDQISGKWINTRTGQVVYARQIIDNGDEAIVVTDIGSIPMSQFCEFVQMGDEVLPAPNVAPSVLTEGLNSEDAKLLSNISSGKKMKENLPSLDKPLSEQSNIQVMSKEQNYSESYSDNTQGSSNYKIINKLFSKFDNLEINLSINWNNFPKDKISTLTDIFDIPKEEIAEYIVKTYMNIKELSKIIEKEL